MSPSRTRGLPSFPDQALVVSMPESNPPSTQEGIMEVVIIPALFVAIFVGIAALILFTPYESK
jgi:hypothetical protein